MCWSSLFEETLSATDNSLASTGTTILILFDALDRLEADWTQIRVLTLSLLRRALGLKSFQSFRTKIFIRPDQFSDPTLFRFPDGSKLKNEHVDLSWQPRALFDLLFFEISRDEKAGRALKAVASEIDARGALRSLTQFPAGSQDDQIRLINALAGSYMGTNARRGRVYTWVPLHLSDAHGACSPRTFLTAWQKAAEQGQAPTNRAVDHLGLIEGVRRASSARLEELREDYFWIDAALGALAGSFVPIEKDDLLKLWLRSKVVQKIQDDAAENKQLTPIDLDAAVDKDLALLEAMKSIAVIEERANGKINVPDIFRVEARIKRKGGVAVPRRT